MESNQASAAVVVANPEITPPIRVHDTQPAQALERFLEQVRPAPHLNYRKGYYAGWDIQAGFYKYGDPVMGYAHRRRCGFYDGSYVEIQAHQPVLTTTDDSNSAVAVVFLLGWTLGLSVGGPVGAAVIDKARPYDAAWQGYTARYYASADATQPWGVRHFYGWVHSDWMGDPVTVRGQTDPRYFVDFADLSRNVRWWAWRSGQADARGLAWSAALVRPPATDRDFSRSLCQEIDVLSQRTHRFVGAPITDLHQREAFDAQALVAAAH